MKRRVRTHVDVRREAARPREVLDELLEALLVERVLRVELGDGALDVQVGQDGRGCDRLGVSVSCFRDLRLSPSEKEVEEEAGRTAVAGTRDEEHLGLGAFLLSLAADEGLRVDVGER